MAEERVYRCLYPKRSISGPDVPIMRFDEQGIFKTSDPERQYIIENHEWFDRIIFLVGASNAPEPKIAHDDSAALAKAQAVAAKAVKQSAKVGLVGSDDVERIEDEKIFNPAMDEPTVPDVPPEPEKLPTRAEMNYMKKADLVKLIKKHGMDVDPKLSYHVLKAEVKGWVERKQLGME
jgi:hypothetical protein